MSVTVIVNLRANDGQADALRALLQRGRHISQTAAGCEEFDLYQGHDDPHQFVMVERWKSVDAHHESFETKILASGHLEKVLAHIAEPIRSGVHQAV